MGCGNTKQVEPAAPEPGPVAFREAAPPSLVTDKFVAEKAAEERAAAEKAGLSVEEWRRQEEEWLQKVQAQDLAAFGTNEPDSDASALASHRRAVTIRWLREFTNKHKCWDWPTWRVVRDIIKAATAGTRCRYVDLPEVQATGCVGEADTFGSHCWNATWGHLVASLSDQSDPNRRVWIDVFAVRQWP